MRTLWISLVSLLWLALAGCGAPETAAGVSPPPADSTAATATGVPVTGATSTVVATGAWKTYHNTQAGYSVEYPDDWTVNESAATGGELITTFMSSTDGEGIIISVLNSDAAPEEIPDMPNTRCQQVTISGLPGRRCFDTVASNLSTTISSHNRQFTVATFGKHLGQDLYQHFLDNFTLTP